MRYCFITFVGCFLFLSAAGQKVRDHHREALLLKKILVQEHFQPRPVDDQFSRQVFDAFMRSLDEDKVYFTSADLKLLEPYRLLIDDELNGQGWKFLDQVTPLFRKCLVRAETTIRKETETAFNPSSKEYFTYDTTQWAGDEKGLQLKWRHWLNYQTLDRLADLQKIHPAEASDFFRKYEPEARSRVKAFELRMINRILNHPSGFENYMASAYFRSIAAVFDPHTTYYDVTDMENFLSSLSTEGYYFGVTLDENDRGNVMITALAPGGPAWKSGEINVSDELVYLQWDHQEPLDMTGISLEEANEILADANHELIGFTVKKSTGLLKTVKLRKEKISLEQNFVRSYVLAGNDGKKVGYISLPDFYTQWGDEGSGSRCANDVAKEVLKLATEKIDGLVLDVRFNGGGSLIEAVALAGIFIDEGPLGMIRSKSQLPASVKDMNRGVIYDGPLVLVVNGQSASASEFLAGAFQDYNRAVIVGSRTFGKATAQNFFPLDPAQKEEPSLASIQNGLGFASITTDKIYRVTGKTAQGRGVVPDIYLPDLFDAFDIHEAGLPFALAADSVFKKSFYKPLPALPLEALRQRCASRLRGNQPFDAVTANSSWLATEFHKKDEPVSLNWELFSKQSNEILVRYKALEEVLTRPATSFSVRNGSQDEQRMDADEYAQEINKAWVKRLQEDIYVEEVFHIIADLVELVPKPRK
jgi:carboxyl-terminal processing protease